MRWRFRALAAIVVLAAVLLGTASGPASAAARAVAVPASDVSDVVPASDAAAAAAAHVAAVAPVPGPVVLLGTGGVSWTDVEHDHLPTLSGLLATDSAGWLADRSVRALTCPVDGWLAVSAGRRAADVQVGPDAGQHAPSCRVPQVRVSAAGGAATVPQWQSYTAEAAKDTYTAHPGLLGATLTAAGRSAAAVGPGAAIALADPQGQVAHAWAGGQSDSGNAGGTVDVPALTADVRSALATRPAVLLVDLGAVRDPARRTSREPVPTGAFATSRGSQERALDSRLGQVLAELPANATVIVASMADSGAPSQLQLLAARGPAPAGSSYLGSLLGSTSTRQDAVAQTTDLLPTLLDALGVTVPDEAVGSAVKPVQTGRSLDGRRRKLLDVGQAADAVHPIAPWFFSGIEIAQLLLYLVATLILRWRSRNDPDAGARRLRTLRRLQIGAVVFAAIPAATFLANLLPWWRYRTPGLAITGAVILFVIPIAALALLGPWRRALLGPLGAVAAITASVLAVDVTTGSHLLLSSLMGMNPVVAGRFYGFGNPAFAVFATGALLLAVSLADWQVRLGRPRRAALFVVLIGLVAVICDGTPGFGSDFGGPPALIPGFAVLALLVLGVRVSWRRAVLIAAVTVAVIVALAVLDWARGPGNRTHVGQFVQTVIDGGAWPVVRRKADANLTILFTSWLTALTPIAVAFVVLVLARPVTLGARPLQLAYDRSPVLKHGIVAFGVLMLLAAGLNDSGLAIPAVGAMVAIPLLIAASVRALELQDATPAPPPLVTAGTPTP